MFGLSTKEINFVIQQAKIIRPFLRKSNRRKTKPQTNYQTAEPDTHSVFLVDLLRHALGERPLLLLGLGVLHRPLGGLLQLLLLVPQLRDLRVSHGNVPVDLGDLLQEVVLARPQLVALRGHVRARRGDGLDLRVVAGFLETKKRTWRKL